MLTSHQFSGNTFRLACEGVAVGGCCVGTMRSISENWTTSFRTTTIPLSRRGMGGQRSLVVTPVSQVLSDYFYLCVSVCMMAVEAMNSRATSQSDSEKEREGGGGEGCEEVKEDGDKKLLKTPAADEVRKMVLLVRTLHTPLFMVGRERGNVFCEGQAVL